MPSSPQDDARREVEKWLRENGEWINPEEEPYKLGNDEFILTGNELAGIWLAAQKKALEYAADNFDRRSAVATAPESVTAYRHAYHWLRARAAELGGSE